MQVTNRKMMITKMKMHDFQKQTASRRQFERQSFTNNCKTCFLLSYLLSFLYSFTFFHHRSLNILLLLCLMTIKCFLEKPINLPHRPNRRKVAYDSETSSQRKMFLLSSRRTAFIFKMKTIINSKVRHQHHYCR